MRHFHNVRLTARHLPAVGILALLLAAAGCEDELNNPQTAMCDVSFEVTLDDVPATIRYLVSADGDAVVQNVTYTTPTGDVTTTDLDHDAPDTFVFDGTEAFDEPVDASLRARGEIAAGGQIGLGFIIQPNEGGTINSDPAAYLCSG